MGREGRRVVVSSSLRLHLLHFFPCPSIPVLPIVFHLLVSVPCCSCFYLSVVLVLVLVLVLLSIFVSSASASACSLTLFCSLVYSPISAYRYDCHDFPYLSLSLSAGLPLVFLPFRFSFILMLFELDEFASQVLGRGELPAVRSKVAREGNEMKRGTE